LIDSDFYSTLIGGIFYNYYLRVLKKQENSKLIPLIALEELNIFRMRRKLK